jgi:sec-independent protein translocase protein TatB
MLDIGWSELLLVAVVAIVVVGPKELPKLMRTFGFYAGKLRRAAADFQRQFDEALVESEADEVRKNIEAIQGTLGERPVMMPKTSPLQNALGEPNQGKPNQGEPLQGESLAALEAEAHASAKRKAPRAKTPRAKPPAKRAKAKRPIKAKQASKAKRPAKRAARRKP